MAPVVQSRHIQVQLRPLWCRHVQVQQRALYCRHDQVQLKPSSVTQTRPGQPMLLLSRHVQAQHMPLQWRQVQKQHKLLQVQSRYVQVQITKIRLLLSMQTSPGKSWCSSCPCVVGTPICTIGLCNVQSHPGAAQDSEVYSRHVQERQKLLFFKHAQVHAPQAFLVQIHTTCLFNFVTYIESKSEHSECLWSCKYVCFVQVCPIMNNLVSSSQYFKRVGKKYKKLLIKVLIECRRCIGFSCSETTKFFRFVLKSPTDIEIILPQRDVGLVH